MESLCGSVPVCFQTASFFADGETHNQRESIIFWHSASVEVSFHAGTQEFTPDLRPN